MRRKASKPSFLFLVVGMMGAIFIWGLITKGTSTSSSSHTQIATGTFNPYSAWPFLASAMENNNVLGNRLARNVYVVFDGSGSMGDTGCSGGQRKIIAAKQALHEFVKTLPPDTNIGLAAFDTFGTSERAHISKVNYDLLSRIIDDVHTGGGTPLRKAMDIGYKALTEQARTQLGYGEYHLLVVTDGMADSGSEPTNLISKILSESPVMIHTIGFCIGKNHSLNQPGKTNYFTAENANDILKGMRAALAEAQDFTIKKFN